MRRLAFGLVALAVCGTAAAQQPPPPGLPSPRIATVFPAGAKAGPPPVITRFGIPVGSGTEVAVTGTDLDEPEKLVFSHPGITGEFVEPPEPQPDPKKKDAPAPKSKGAAAGPHKFRVTVAKDVPPGTYDLRVAGKWGVSNPRAFVVGTRPEANEQEPNNDVPEAQRAEVGTTVNGVLANGTDVDYTVFAGKKGQRVVVACLATAIDSRANPMIEVYDATGRRLALNRNYRDGDAVADLALPADGEYYVRLCQFTYQGGGPDYTYRLTISEAPWIDAVFPPAIPFGKPAQVTLYGRNLPNGQPADGFTVDGRPLEKLTVTVTPPTDPAAASRLAVRGRIDPITALQDGFEYVFKGPTGASNPVPIYFTPHKQVLKKNAGGTTAATAEAIPAPCEVAGFLARRGDSDWYSFEAKKGEQLLVEVSAERNGAEGDFFLSVRDGKDPKRDLSGELDDDNETLHQFGFFNRSGDPPAYKFTAPEAGKYLVLVGCREAGVLCGPRAAYRLRVSPAKPDFRAVVMPYSRHYQTGSSAWQGGNQAYDVFVHRIDGFNGPVTVAAGGLPKGVTAKPLVVGPNSKWGVLSLTVAADAPEFTGTFTVKAVAKSPDGKELERDARPACVVWGTNTMQQNVPVVVRLADGLPLAVRPEKAFFTLAPDPDKATTKVNNKDEKLATLTVKQGDKFSLPVKVNWVASDKQAVVLTAEPVTQSQQANPITVQIPTQPTKDKPEAVANFDVKANAPPGTYSVVLKGVAQVPFARPGPGGAMAKGGNVPAEAFTDPIQVVVIPNALAKVTAGPLPNNTLKRDSETNLTVKVERLHDFAGEFAVTFVPADDKAGVTAEEVTIPAGGNEAKLTLVTAEDAKPGMLAGVIVVTAKYADKHTVKHENKVSFTVAK